MLAKRKYNYSIILYFYQQFCIALQLAQGRLLAKVCWFSFAWFALHVAYITLRLPNLCLMGVNIPLLSVPWHFTILLATDFPLWLNVVWRVATVTITLLCREITQLTKHSPSFAVNGIHAYACMASQFAISWASIGRIYSKLRSGHSFPSQKF